MLTGGTKLPYPQKLKVVFWEEFILPGDINFLHKLFAPF